ncbi:hypothetical protein [Paraburkholderia sp. GAS199]|uniref:hypothetical protein n=1 Tax=Paraburkholderia sp. GAS199 TaxID=3035126 RepID=UPI003D1D8526
MALIEGNLAIPKPRPFDGLPPPFGTRAREVAIGKQSAMQREEAPVQVAAQQAFKEAAEQKSPVAPRNSFPPGVRHFLFYKLPVRRPDTHRFDAAMAEAKRYLEMGKTRPRSSRTDYVIGATIFVGCSIALAWLLATCTMRDADKPTQMAKAAKPAIAAAVAEATAEHRKQPLTSTPLASSVAQKVIPMASMASKITPPPTVTSSMETKLAVASATENVEKTPKVSALSDFAVKAVTPSQTSRMPRTIANAKSPTALREPHSSQVQHAAQQSTARTTARDVSLRHLTKQDYQPVVEGVSKAQIDSRVALNRTTSPMKESNISNPVASNVRNAQAEEKIELETWRRWAQQQRTQVTTRAATESDWNARMTQRRITDNPEAFNAGAAPAHQ